MTSCTSFELNTIPASGKIASKNYPLHKFKVENYYTGIEIGVWTSKVSGVERGSAVLL